MKKCLVFLTSILTCCGIPGDELERYEFISPGVVGVVYLEQYYTETGERCGFSREWDRDGTLIEETDTGVPCE